MVRRRELLKTAGVAGTIGLTASAGCIGQFGSEPYGDGEIRFLMSPTEPQDQMRAQYTPIKERLNNHIGEVDTVSMKYAADYSATLTALDSGTADLAETGPFAAALGVNTDKAEVILQRKGFGSWKYRSNIVTREGTDVENLSDLEGETIAFADPLSASGSLFPLHMLKQAGLSIPEEPGSSAAADFDPQWSSHAAAKEALVNEQAMAAGIGYFMVRGDESEYEDGIRALKVRKGIPRAPILVSPGLADDEKEQLTTAFTEAPDDIYLGEDGEADTDDDLWFNDVREAGVDTYQPVIDVANELGYGEDIFAEG
jgi:phosphonate transport system substrate-binding protein